MLPRAIRRRLGTAHLALTPPPPAPDRHGIALVLIARNEAAHLEEWGRFHRLAGVRRVIFYDNGSADGSAEALAAGIGAERLTVMPWAQSLAEARSGIELNAQAMAYAHAVANFGAAYRWMGFIDADEFLVPVGGATLPQALEGLDVPNLSLPWHMFGTGGNATPPEAGTVAGFLDRAPVDLEGGGRLTGFKMLVDPSRVTRQSIHEARTGDDATWNDRGEKASFTTRESAGFYSAERVQLNHYYTRSRAELEAKIGRGPNFKARAAAYGRTVQLTAEAIEAKTLRDTRAADWFAAARSG